MARKSNAKRMKRLEDIAIGAGLLLQKLQYRYGGDFGVGLDQQVRQCINDCSQVGQARMQREAAEAASAEATHA